MKRLFIIAVTFLLCLNANAQDIEPIVFDMKNVSINNDKGKMIGLMGAWKKVVEKYPQNQRAWRNLFFATFIGEGNSLSDLNTDDFKKPRTALVMRKMKEAIPDSYVFYLCACHFWLEKEWGKWDKDILRKAIEMMPYDACDEDVLRLAKLLWEKDCNNDKLLTKVYYRIYDKHLYPYREMRYGWNLVKSMPQNAIFVAHDAMELEPVNEDYVAKFTMHLIKETKHPLYQPLDMINYSNLCMDSLYNEGLLVKYSDKRYDNISVLLNNVRNVYDLKYLAEPPLVKDLNYDSTNEHKIVMSLTYVVKLLRKRGLENEANYFHSIIFEFCVKNADGPLARRVSDILSNRNYENTPDL